MRKIRITFSAAVATFVLAACGQNSVAPTAGGSTASCTSRAYPDIGGPISLIDHNGNAVTEADFKGTPTMIYFGFTFCPDVCPLSLVNLRQAYDRLPAGTTVPRTLLITVDPERDTPEKLAEYVTTGAFPENLTGLTGSPEQIRAAANNFYADYSRVEDDTSAAGYVMDHTSLIYLMDEDWQLKTFFTHEDTPETISSCIETLLD